MSFDSASLMAFVNLAINGNQQACNNAERAAHLLAQAVLDYLPCLDRQATEGLMCFISAAHAQPMAAREMLESRQQ